MSFKSAENNHNVCRGKNYLKTICESLREYAMKIINFKKKKNEVINNWTVELVPKLKNLL